MIFLRINLPNFVQFKQYQGKLGLLYHHSLLSCLISFVGTAYPQKYLGTAFPLDYTTVCG